MFSAAVLHLLFLLWPWRAQCRVSGPFFRTVVDRHGLFFKKRVRFPDPVSGLPLSGAYKGRGQFSDPIFKSSVRHFWSLGDESNWQGYSILAMVQLDVAEGTCRQEGPSHELGRDLVSPLL